VVDELAGFGRVEGRAFGKWIECASSLAVEISSICVFRLGRGCWVELRIVKIEWGDSSLSKIFAAVWTGIPRNSSASCSLLMSRNRKRMDSRLRLNRRISLVSLRSRLLRLWFQQIRFVVWRARIVLRRRLRIVLSWTLRVGRRDLVWRHRRRRGRVRMRQFRMM
jgi:hypothetical protein